MNYALMIVALFLAACQVEEMDGPIIVDPGYDEFCPADEYSWMIGRNISAVTLPSDLDDRLITPDTVVTRDYRPDRMNIMVDDDGLITDVNCG